MEAHDAAKPKYWRILKTNTRYRVYPRYDAVHMDHDDPRWRRTVSGTFDTEEEARAEARSWQESARRNWLAGRGRDISAEACAQWQRAFAGIPAIRDGDARFERHAGKPRILLTYTYCLPSGQDIRVHIRTSVGCPPLERAVRLLRVDAARAAHVPPDSLE